MGRVRKISLRPKEAKEVLREFNEKFDSDVSGRRVEKASLNGQTIYMVDGNPVILIVEGVMVPTLINTDTLKKIPTITVDMGAVPHICDGADVMVPGVRDASLPLERGVTVVIVDEKFHKPIAVGVTLLELRNLQGKGKAVKNLHYVGDNAWKLLKS